jgi:hypothetical protein
MPLILVIRRIDEQLIDRKNTQSVNFKGTVSRTKRRYAKIITLNSDMMVVDEDQMSQMVMR